jgi:hypothetical protein
VYGEFFNWSNFELRSIRSNNIPFGWEFETQAHFLDYLLAKLHIWPLAEDPAVRRFLLQRRG